MTPWQTKWLRLTLRCPKVQDLADKVQSFGFAWYRHDTQKRGLVLTGPPGVGKTHCARKLADWARYVAFRAMEIGKWSNIPSVQYCRWPEACTGFESGQIGVMEDLTSSSLLVLDDIGAESDRFRSGQHNDRLCQVLTRRGDAQLYTLVTTNIAPEDWETRFDARIADRLLRGSVVCDLTEIASFAQSQYQQSSDA